MTASHSVDSGWGPCHPRKVLKPSYTCQGIVETKQYRNVTTLAITDNIDGKVGSNSSVTSTQWCN